MMTMESRHDNGSSIEIASFTEFIKPVYAKKAMSDWPFVESALQKHGLSATLDQFKRSITVSTTTRTQSQNILDRARGCIILISKTLFSRNVAIKVLDGKLYYDYIEIGFQEGGLAAIHGIKKEVYNHKLKNLSEHITKIGRASHNCTIHMREDFICAVGRINWCVKKMRVVARNMHCRKHGSWKICQEGRKGICKLQISEEPREVTHLR